MNVCPTCGRCPGCGQHPVSPIPNVIWPRYIPAPTIQPWIPPYPYIGDPPYGSGGTFTC